MDSFGEHDYRICRAIAAVALGLFFSATAREQFFTDTGSPTNPSWSAIKPTLNAAAPDPGPVRVNISCGRCKDGIGLPEPRCDSVLACP